VLRDWYQQRHWVGQPSVGMGSELVSGAPWPPGPPPGQPPSSSAWTPDLREYGRTQDQRGAEEEQPDDAEEEHDPEEQLDDAEEEQRYDAEYQQQIASLRGAIEGIAADIGKLPRVCESDLKTLEAKLGEATTALADLRRDGDDRFKAIMEKLDGMATRADVADIKKAIDSLASGMARNSPPQRKEAGTTTVEDGTTTEEPPGKRGGETTAKTTREDGATTEGPPRKRRGEAP